MSGFFSGSLDFSRVEAAQAAEYPSGQAGVDLNLLGFLLGINQPSSTLNEVAMNAHFRESLSLPGTLTEPSNEAPTLYPTKEVIISPTPVVAPRVIEKSRNAYDPNFVPGANPSAPMAEAARIAAAPYDVTQTSATVGIPVVAVSAGPEKQAKFVAKRRPRKPSATAGAEDQRLEAGEETGLVTGTGRTQSENNVSEYAAEQAEARVIDAQEQQEEAVRDEISEALDLLDQANQRIAFLLLERGLKEQREFTWKLDNELARLRQRDQDSDSMLCF